MSRLLALLLLAITVLAYWPIFSNGFINYDDNGYVTQNRHLQPGITAGNVAWAVGCLTQAQRHLSGRDRSVELAILGRLGAEVEHEICHLLEAQGVT